MKSLFHHTPRYFVIRKCSNPKLEWIQIINFYKKIEEPPIMRVSAGSKVSYKIICLWCDEYYVFHHTPRFFCD